MRHATIGAWPAGTSSSCGGWVGAVDTFVTTCYLAGCLSKQGKHAEAEELLQGVLAAEQRTLGPDHADTLKTASLLAEAQAAVCWHVRASTP